MLKPYLAWRRFNAVVFFLIAAIIYSCRKDSSIITVNNKAGTLVSNAREWYEHSYPRKIKSNAKRLSSINQPPADDLSQFIQPDWDRGASFLRDGRQVIELPLNTVTKLSVSFGSQIPDFNKSYSKSSFIIIGQSNNYEAYLMTIVADSAYLEADFSKLNKNTFKSKESNFDGRLLYHTIKGEFLTGWVYKNGHIVGVISGSANQNQDETASKYNTSKYKRLSDDCSTSRMDIYTGTVCTGIDGPVTYCTDWYNRYDITTCSTGGDGTGRDVDDTESPSPDMTGSNEPYPWPVVKIIKNNINDPCLKKMVAAAITRNIQYNLTQSMNSIFGRNANFNLEFIDAPLASSTDGITQTIAIDGHYIYEPDGVTIQRITDIKGMDVRITLNSTTLPNASEEYITATILHEALHAYFRAGNNVSSFDHNTMVNQYIPWYEAIMSSMYVSMSTPDLRGLAYGGLMNEAAFTTSTEYAMKNAYSLINDSYKGARSGTACH
jgi:hypothetical protein